MESNTWAPCSTIPNGQRPRRGHRLLAPPLVLVAMSSTFQDQIGSLQRVIDALAALPVCALVTTGPALDVAALRPASNVTVVASAPHRQVLRHTAMVITHGGHGTVVKALAAGVPMVLLPHGRDQTDTAVRVSGRGAGVMLKRSVRPAPESPQRCASRAS